MADDIFGQYPPCRWVVGSKDITIPVARYEVTYENRLAEHERLYRDGARLDDTFSKAIVHTLTVDLFNGHLEPGVPGNTLYPDTANAICESFLIHETGTLHTPTQGPRRCRAHMYTRVEDHGERDMAALRLVFKEDNEDDARAAAFKAPSALSVSRTLSEKTVRDMQKAGAFNDAVSELLEFGAELEGLASAPQQTVQDLDEKATALSNKCDAVERAFTKSGSENAAEINQILRDPRGSRAGRNLRRLSDTSRRATLDKAGVGRDVTTRTYNRVVSIFDVAVDVGQDAAALIRLNPKLLDSLAIPEKTPIYVYKD